MTTQEITADVKRAKRPLKYAVIVGVVLALICSSVPPQYRAVCDVLATLCTL